VTATCQRPDQPSSKPSNSERPYWWCGWCGKDLQGTNRVRGAPHIQYDFCRPHCQRTYMRDLRITYDAARYLKQREERAARKLSMGGRS
jgi:hypothetical protein